MIWAEPRALADVMDSRPAMVGVHAHKRESAETCWTAVEGLLQNLRFVSCSEPVLHLPDGSQQFVEAYF